MPVYIIGRGIGYHREGIDDVGDIIEVWDGPEPPSGPGYALSDIVTVEVLSREVVDAILNAKRPNIVEDPEDPEKAYWQNPEDSEWYEVVVKPKYDLNFADLTLGDRATLADEESTILEKTTALGKIVTNITKYPENTQTLVPGGPPGFESVK